MKLTGKHAEMEAAFRELDDVERTESVYRMLAHAWRIKPEKVDERLEVLDLFPGVGRSKRRKPSARVIRATKKRKAKKDKDEKDTREAGL